ncbi:uncharacterized protein MYCGRDRAFT_109219 [Zymoseptoria tritici IPO323]|uniref:C2H2-type domain-containing protein n=1 Tax=Zymoseptoria tritici (strain CBS 115943 / IPO323) TaxID=336722 RepID=F9X9R7_ZYMTI|nr:uncharacterized protein MYCGRDRAFT_109219 [Zymoseptoria tritici IPO323]EGP88057.1 hypothetical protein MYCGRDRAFT_109219 [Zymoseptoria tritici IPO323]
MDDFGKQHSRDVTSGNDFTLYPYSESWSREHSYPSTTYAEQAYLTAPFEPYKQQDYTRLQEQYQFGANQAISHAKRHLHSAHSNYSPAHSVAHSFDHHYLNHIASVSDSSASVQSTISSAMGSPSAQHHNDWSHHNYPSIVQHDGTFAQSVDNNMDIPAPEKGCVDPSLIQPYSPAQYVGNQFQEMNEMPSPRQQIGYAATASPEPSSTSIVSPRQQVIKTQRPDSPFMRQNSWQQYPQSSDSRRRSISSAHSKHSHHSTSSDESNKGVCPIPTCGRNVKDLKAHALTHQNERPEKCSVVSCEYHIKGFARKYDKNRHTLTHYKGTMVCGFCHGSGSAAEKSFNRADVFKRHLTSVHGVEQTPQSARRKSPAAGSKKAVEVSRDATGMCSTCSKTFASAQDFYEHLDDCVLRVVQQADPTDAINEKLLLSVAEDDEVIATLARNMLPTNLDYAAPTTFAESEADEDEDMIEEDDSNDATYGNRSSRSKRPSLKSRHSTKSNTSHVSSTGSVCKPTRKGLTLSKSGVSLAAPPSKDGPKRRKNYPLSWGAAPDKMKMRKRVLCVYDGQRRLWKDDMMLSADHEVRIPLTGPETEGRQEAWITDLDVQTLRRADALHNATEEEKGPWVEDEELERLML